MKKMLTTLAAVLCYAAVFTSCNDDITPPGYKDLGGTWVADVSGNTFSIWNYGKAWNVWTFNADGTGVCNVFFLMGEEPVAIAADLRKAFDKAILQRADISWSVQHLDRYSLSVCLYKQTGWGDFLRINNGLPWGNPTSGGGGPIE